MYLALDSGCYNYNWVGLNIEIGFLASMAELMIGLLLFYRGFHLVDLIEDFGSLIEISKIDFVDYNFDLVASR